MIRVALFEDNWHFRETIEWLIGSSEQLCVSGVYADARHAVAMLRQHPADVILMDIEMPGINGIEATRLIKQHYPDVHVLVQTVFADDRHIVDAILAGAAGYILKNSSPEAYIQAIIDVQYGGAPMTPGIARRLLFLFKNQGRLTDGSAAYDLTKQEMVVLEQLVGGKSYKMIAAELFISPETVKTHVGRIYAKLNVHSGTEAVAKALREGLV
jgi:DNA-binding NarL/FixJ family response regulator